MTAQLNQFLSDVIGRADDMDLTAGQIAWELGLDHIFDLHQIIHGQRPLTRQDITTLGRIVDLPATQYPTLLPA